MGIGVVGNIPAGHLQRAFIEGYFLSLCLSEIISPMRSTFVILSDGVTDVKPVLFRLLTRVLRQGTGHDRLRVSVLKQNEGVEAGHRQDILDYTAGAAADQLATERHDLFRYDVDSSQTRAADKLESGEVKYQRLASF